MRRAARAQHQLVVVNQIDQARVPARGFDDHVENRLERLRERELSRHQAAYFLEHLQLALGPREPLLQFLRLLTARHEIPPALFASKPPGAGLPNPPSLTTTLT